jgi:SagB-type dehydrogenase family enzyme
LAEVGQLCWAAQGVTDAKGHRTAPSAHATYPLRLYVLAGAVGDLAPGLYRYVPAAHAIELTAVGDRRLDFEQRAVGQAWIARAPVIFVLSGSVAKMASMGDRAAQLMAVEAGLAALGFFLQAEALGARQHLRRRLPPARSARCAEAPRRRGGVGRTARGAQAVASRFRLPSRAGDR